MKESTGVIRVKEMRKQRQGRYTVASFGDIQNATGNEKQTNKTRKAKTTVHSEQAINKQQEGKRAFSNLAQEYYNRL